MDYIQGFALAKGLRAQGYTANEISTSHVDSSHSEDWNKGVLDGCEDYSVIAFGLDNPDAMTVEDLQAHADQLNMILAAMMQYQTYCNLKLRAMKFRLAGNIKMATSLEFALDKHYSAMREVVKSW